uniref:RING-CH-type domain-containing protein n=1 Tax=Aegilops tauschii subsp. strangulata TaxID=200361 RepID=A0A453G5Z1_AEGTS
MARVEKVAGGEGQVEEAAMDSPCACTGTLKFAHRKCIQRWCDKKGNITCEICNQVYSPNYVLPPTKCCSDEMGMDLRQSWVGRIDPHDSHFLAIAIAEQQLLNAEFDDCMTSNSSGATCCRSIALIVCYRTLFLSKPIFYYSSEGWIMMLIFVAVDVPSARAPCNRDRARC